MKNSSDESDYEEDNVVHQENDESDDENQSFNMSGLGYDSEGVPTEKESYLPCFSNRSHDEKSNRKRNHSVEYISDDTSNDSDASFDESFDEKESNNVYQNLHGEQDSACDGSSQSLQNGHLDDSFNSTDEAEESGVKMNRTTYEIPTKRRKTDLGSNDEEIHYSLREQFLHPIQEPKNISDGQDKVQRMMQKMGYKEGHGLGKNQQGRLEPVEASKQHGRRGLGHHIPGLEATSLKWDPEKEEINVIEDIEWIKSPDSLPEVTELEDWIQIGPKKLTIEDETYFCHEDIVQNIVNAKSAFDKLDDVEMRRARTRSNPFETIRNAFFLNRAAVKMANMDRACNFMFTNPKCLEENGLLYFADVCAGPGGFSEYVLWRKGGWHAKGFGFTLKNENDFKLSDFYAGPCETFHPYYGPKENGDVFDPSNQAAFKNLIMKHTDGKGVHFMMSDGGFSVEGQENIQEILSKQLYLCQCIVALMIVRVKGHFVTKLFDLFTPFSAGLVYLMYRCFEEVSIFKPNSSRPANSERYLICKNKRPHTEGILRYLKYVNKMLSSGDENNDVLQLVSFEELEREKQFVQYLRESNEILGRKQIIGLCKIAAFCENTNLVEVKQAEMRKECLKYWQLPDQSRTMPRQMEPKSKLNQLIQNNSSLLSSAPQMLTVENLESTLHAPYNWFCMPCGTTTGSYSEELKNATFYMGMGRSNVYRYCRNSWVQPDDIKIELPAGTLIYAEVVFEMRRELKSQQKVLALHILDAFSLGTENISNRYLKDRHELTKKFCKALWKPEASPYARIRVKDLIPLGSSTCKRLHVTQRRMKNNDIKLTYEFSETPFERDDSNSEKPYFVPNSVIFLTSTAHYWSRHISQKQSKTYVYNRSTRCSMFESERPTEAEADFIETYKNRLIWYWPSDQKLTAKVFDAFIQKHCRPFDVRLKY